MMAFPCNGQGIIQQAPESWTQFEPIVIPSLPYYAKFPVRIFQDIVLAVLLSASEYCVCVCAEQQ